jgi:anti-sigma factor RsiW
MPSCREVEPLVTRYVDGEATAADRAVVDAHLMMCPPCRHRAAAETAARNTVRTRLCRPCAPEQLRTRCRAAAHTGPFGMPRVTLTSMSMAAALVFVVGGVLLYSLTGLSPTVLAAQLTLDHVKCFAVHDADAPVDPRASEAQYARDYGQQIHLPQIAAAGLQLVGVRRCYCGEGAVAHAMYRLNGRPISLYIIPDASRSRATAAVFGHDAVIWTNQTTTYVLVGRETPEALETLARAIDRGL